jgi:hypothetical protein
MKPKRVLKAYKQSYKLPKEWTGELDAYVSKCREFLARSGDIWNELQVIFTNIGVNPVLIGGMAVRLFAEPVMTYDYDILLSRDDFLKLKKGGRGFGLIYKHDDSFRYKDTVIECLVEGEKVEGGAEPSPDLVRGEGFSPSLEGIFFLKLISFRPRDREHLARLFSRGLDEEKLHALIASYGREKLWERYLELKRFWTFK